MRTSLKLEMNLHSFQSLSQLSLPTYFVKCRRTLLELNSLEPYPSSEREIKFRCCLFTSPIEREIRHFHVVVVQKRAKKCTKSVMHVQRCCFAYKTYCFFDDLIAVRVVDLKVPNVFSFVCPLKTTSNRFYPISAKMVGIVNKVYLAE